MQLARLDASENTLSTHIIVLVPVVLVNAAAARCPHVVDCTAARASILHVFKAD
jgi:hypothetical protein